MVGGDLHWIWKPYTIYQEVDYVRRIVSDHVDANLDRDAWDFAGQVYGVKALQENNGFTNAQGKPTYRHFFVVRRADYHRCSGCSCPESRRDCPQCLLLVPGACGEVPSCLGSWVYERDSDILQDGTVLAAGILLQLLRRWSQRFEDIDRLLDHS
jgi:hypothetical protein